jgi:hypothetical protein
MSASNPDVSLALILVMVAVAAVATVALRRAIRARNRERQRIVEQPNSHYTSVVRATETRHRWKNISLEGVHEINQGEVKRLLAKADAAGVDSLREAERVFLDNISNLSGSKSSTTPREQGSPLASDLRHRPA